MPFPSLFALVASKEAWVADVWDDMGQGGHWNRHFIRPLNDWELNDVNDFFLKNSKVCEEGCEG